MAFKMSVSEIQKLRKESEEEEVLRKLTLEDEIRSMDKQRKWLMLDIEHIKNMQLTDEDCHLQDERALRNFRRDRTKELLTRQQRIEQEMMSMQRELDHMEIQMRYRRNMEMLEDEEEEDEICDFEGDYDEHLVIDEYVERASDPTDSATEQEDNLQPQSHRVAMLKDKSTVGEAGKNVLFKSSSEKKQSQEHEHQSTKDTLAKQVQIDRNETAATRDQACQAQQQSEIRTHCDPLQSTTREKEYANREKTQNKTVRLNISDVSQIETKECGSRVEQTSFMKRMDTEILDLDRRLAALNDMSSQLLERTRERISSSSRMEPVIIKEYDRMHANGIDLKQGDKYHEQCYGSSDNRGMVPERCDQNMEDGLMSRRKPREIVRQMETERPRFIKDMFSDRESVAGKSETGYIQNVYPAVEATETLDHDKDYQYRLPSSRRNRQFPEDGQQEEMIYEERKRQRPEIFVRDKGTIEPVMNRGPDQHGYVPQDMNDLRQQRDRDEHDRYAREEPYLHTQEHLIENEERIITKSTVRETYVQEKERQLAETQRQLQEREIKLEAQEEVERQRHALTPYDEALQRKEEILEKKFKALRLKEAQIKLREESMKELAENSESRIRKLEKEIMALQQEDEGIKEDFKKDNNDSTQRQGNTQVDSSVNTDSTGELQSALSSKATSVQDRPYNFSRFNNFSGEDPKPKKEASFEEWKYEVNCARGDPQNTESSIAQAIRKSLSGQAKRVILPLGISSTVEEMMVKLEGVFGNVATGMSVLEEFYSTTQKQGESVNTWSLRLEELIQRAIDKGQTRPEEKNSLLKEKFWRCLRSERLKNATQIYYHTLDTFEDLRTKVRVEETAMEVKRGIQHQPVNTLQYSQGFQREETEDTGNTVSDRLTNVEQELKQLKKRKPFRKWDQQNQQNQQNDQNQQRQQQQPVNLDSTAKKGNNNPLNM